MLLAPCHFLARLHFGSQADDCLVVQRSIVNEDDLTETVVANRSAGDCSASQSRELCRHDVHRPRALKIGLSGVADAPLGAAPQPWVLSMQRRCEPFKFLATLLLRPGVGYQVQPLLDVFAGRSAVT